MSHEPLLRYTRPLLFFLKKKIDLYCLDSLGERKKKMTRQLTVTFLLFFLALHLLNTLDIWILHRVHEEIRKRPGLALLYRSVRLPHLVRRHRQHDLLCPWRYQPHTRTHIHTRAHLFCSLEKQVRKRRVVLNLPIFCTLCRTFAVDSHNRPDQGHGPVQGDPTRRTHGGSGLVRPGPRTGRICGITSVSFSWIRRGRKHWK